LIAISIAFDPPSFIDLPAALGASVLIAYVISRPRAASRFDRLFVVGGALSYSVYLWHVPVIDAFDRPDPSWAGAFVSAIVTAAVASLVYLAIERPAISLSHRLRPHARRPLYLDPVLPR
jgi:peptidoglycan/LPS O-acetylase OafA/YrhL